MPFTVLLVDDHAVVRQGIRSIFEADAAFKIIGEASDGLEAVRLAERRAPDLVVLDIMMPGLNGFDAMRIIRRRSPRSRVVVLSMYDSVAFAAEALQCGAQGYVWKSSQVRDILTAAHAAMAGRRFLSEPLSEQAIEAHLAKLNAQGGTLHELLTPREREVLQLAAEGKTCAEIGGQLSISERTVERHRASAMKKLGLATQTDLVVYALRHALLPPTILHSG